MSATAKRAKGTTLSLREKAANYGAEKTRRLPKRKTSKLRPLKLELSKEDIQRHNQMALGAARSSLE